jgi:hypothetical protein
VTKTELGMDGVQLMYQGHMGSRRALGHASRGLEADASASAGWHGAADVEMAPWPGFVTTRRPHIRTDGGVLARRLFPAARATANRPGKVDRRVPAVGRLRRLEPLQGFAHTSVCLGRAAGAMSDGSQQT